MVILTGLQVWGLGAAVRIKAYLVRMPDKDWSGAFLVDCKYDPLFGHIKVIKFNGSAKIYRFWASHEALTFRGRVGAI